ncbi:MAG: hypothetical protein ACYS0E_13195 [Planctomycetota bacterium]|jgi:microsomal dipeptidase-like Zn-dependent dipeptidase
MVRDQKADGVLDAPDRWKQILVRLAKRGHNEEALRKLAGANYLRVYRKVLR